MKEIKVPGCLTRHMSDEDKALFEEKYKAATTVLRIINKELQKRLDNAVMDSETLTDINEILINIGQRRALRQLSALLIDHKN